MRFGSVCSGIEAASVAWHPLGWQAAWLAEIEPFPSAVLKHHYPEVPNLGDMTTLPDRIRGGEVEAPDLFCGGTPCQAFSVAGLRRSLDDARGNLSLTFCEIADAIDAVRLAGGKPASIVFWENVPGVLSTADNAFGCFLAGLAGDDEPAQAPNGKWKAAGVVVGPERLAVWRVLDAKYFGVAQRRRRIFVLGVSLRHPRAWAIAESLLPLRKGVRRDSAPSREAGEGPARGASAGAGVGIDFQNAALSGDMAGTLDAEGQKRGNRGYGVLLGAAMQVRRLTPVECERLQGFPDNYTAIPWRGRPASECPDGPRYKALGNSWAVPVVRWIGRRINERIGNA